MAVYGFNNKVACEPFASKAPETRLQGGVKYFVSKTTLVPLKVIYGNLEAHIAAGDTVYVLADLALSVWGKGEIDVEGESNKKMILVPLTSVELVKREPVAKVVHIPPRPTPTSIPGPGTPYTP